jgi:hypothetical protein
VPRPLGLGRSLRTRKTSRPTGKRPAQKKRSSVASFGSCSGPRTLTVLLAHDASGHPWGPFLGALHDVSGVVVSEWRRAPGASVSGRRTGRAMQMSCNDVQTGHRWADVDGGESGGRAGPRVSWDVSLGPNSNGGGFWRWPVWRSGDGRGNSGMGIYY